jgi:hypothetical protein
MMAPTPYCTRDWSHRAVYRKPSAEPVGLDPARVPLVDLARDVLSPLGIDTAHVTPLV